MGKLTAKQEKFCLKYHECGNASEAYRHAYNCERMKPASVTRKAFDLLQNVNITAMLNELKKEAQDLTQMTVQDLIAELEENRQAALQAETVQSSAATAATMGKAKLLGLDKQIIDHTSSDGSMSSPKFILVDDDE